MMVKNKDGTYKAGLLDVLCILHNVNTGRYHAAFFEESPIPGDVKTVNETEVVRLKSKMHHTEGSETLEGALEQLKELSEQIIVSEENIRKDPIDWDGEIGITFLWENWRNGNSFDPK